MHRLHFSKGGLRSGFFGRVRGVARHRGDAGLVYGVRPQWESGKGPLIPSAEWRLVRRAMEQQQQGCDAAVPLPITADVLAHFGLESSERRFADVTSTALTEDLHVAGKSKKLKEVQMIVAELHLRLVTMPRDPLGPDNGCANMVRLLSGLMHMPHVPLTLSFAKAIVMGLSFYAVEMSPEQAGRCLGALSVIDCIYHVDVLQTLVFVTWAGLIDDAHELSPACLEWIADGLLLVEDFLTEREIQVFCKRVVRAVSCGTMNFSLCVSLLSRLRRDASVLLMGPEIEKLIQAIAPSLQRPQLMPALRLCMRLVGHPSANSALVPVLERFVRLVYSQTEGEKVVDLAFVFEFMSAVELPPGHALRAVWSEIYRKVIHRIESLIAIQVPAKEHAVNTVVDDAHEHGAVKGSAVCAACGALLPWPADAAPFCLHVCNLTATLPLSVDQHVEALDWLLRSDADMCDTDLSRLLLLWFGNRFSVELFDKMNATQRAKVTRVIMELSRRKILIASGALSIRKIDSPNAVALHQSIAAFIAWQEACAALLNPSRPLVTSRIRQAEQLGSVKLDIWYSVFNEAVWHVRRSEKETKTAEKAYRASRYQSRKRSSSR